MPRKPRIPKYSLHKPSGRARVIIDGQHIWLGRFNSEESIERYNRLVAELATTTGRAPSATPTLPGDHQTVVEILAAYRKWAEGYYQKGGQTTEQYRIIKATLRPVQNLYGRAPVSAFGPTALKAVRQTMIDSGLCRKEINRRVRIIKHMFRWAASEELIPVSIYQGLATVDGLRRGRTEAPDHPTVGAVDDSVVDATLPYLPEIVVSMIRLQRLTGARPGEICCLRPCDVDRSEKVWLYRPATHKTEHFDRPRTIFIGPKAQAILTPFLLRPAESFCFSPAEVVKRQRDKRHEARTTPLSCGNKPGNNRVRKPKRKPRDRYRKDAYGNVVRRAIQKANLDREKAGLDPLPRWTPNMLRHSAATEIRRQFDLEAVQSILGHASMNTSEIYAEKNMDLARTVALKIG